MKVSIRCFASVRELLGAELLERDVDEGTTLGALKAMLAREAPDLARLRVAFAVNQDYATEETVLQDGDEVAFIPPISGGAAPAIFAFELTREALDARALEDAVRTDRDGAVVTFSGVTRDHNEGDQVLSLRYEAYDGMAEKVMGRIFEDAIKRFEIGRARVAHRLGEVPVGEASVVVVVAAPHRAPAFDAARYLMDRLKAEVPIFKQELLDDGSGSSRWVGELPDV